MPTPEELIANLEGLLARGSDAPSLRLALATGYLAAGDAAAAARHAEAAVGLDPEYSAGWKVLGRSLTSAGRADAAIKAYEQGIAVAERRGDRQAAKEMQVFLRRLRQRSQS